MSIISGYIVKNVACSLCIDMLIENLPDHSYTKNVSFTTSVNRGKLFNASTAICLILQKAFQIVVIKKKQLHKNVKKNVIECARKNIIYFFIYVLT